MKFNRWHRLKWTIPLILFLTAIIDAVLPAIFPKAFISPGQIIIPHITLYFIIVFAFYFRDSNILLYSFIFGLFYDSYNTMILGLYAAIYFIIAYSVVHTKKYFPKNSWILASFFVISFALLDLIVYLFYLKFGYTTIGINTFLASRLAPTFIFNIVLIIVLYYPTKWVLRQLGYEDYLIF